MMAYKLIIASCVDFQRSGGFVLLWKMKMDNGQSKKGRYCPFIGDPLRECFLIDMNSQNIEQAIYYCGGNFEKCEIYRNRIRNDLSRSRPDWLVAGGNGPPAAKKRGDDVDQA